MSVMMRSCSSKKYSLSSSFFLPAQVPSILSLRSNRTSLNPLPFYLYNMQNALASLHTSLLQMVPLTDAAWQDMQPRLVRRTYKKHQLFVAEDKVCKELAFISEGSFRLFKVMDGVEITTFFSFEKSWISSYTSFLLKTPSYVSVQAMEDSEVWVINYDDMQYMYAHHPMFERFGRLMAEYIFTCIDERMHSLLLKTPEERYLKTLNDNSIYFERVPQHYIASYLGVAPESLSRIRKRVMKRALS